MSLLALLKLGKMKKCKNKNINLKILSTSGIAFLDLRRGQCLSCDAPFVSVANFLSDEIWLSL